MPLSCVQWLWHCWTGAVYSSSGTRCTDNFQTRRVTETMYIYLDNDMSFIPALRSVSSSAGVSSAKICRWSRVRDLTAIFFYWNKTDCWLLYAYVLVYASMYWYITVITLCNSIKQVCSSMQQYVLVHTINDIHCSSMYLYILVHTCTY